MSEFSDNWSFNVPALVAIKKDAGICGQPPAPHKSPSLAKELPHGADGAVPDMILGRKNFSIMDQNRFCLLDIFRKYCVCFLFRMHPKSPQDRPHSVTMGMHEKPCPELKISR